MPNNNNNNNNNNNSKEFKNYIKEEELPASPIIDIPPP